jgi:hypothetical protein
MEMGNSLSLKNQASHPLLLPFSKTLNSLCSSVTVLVKRVQGIECNQGSSTCGGSWDWEED